MRVREGPALNAARASSDIPKGSPDAAELCDLVGALDRDRERSEDELRARDAAIGRAALAELPDADATTRLRHWLARAREGESAEEVFGSVTLVAVLLGGLLGGLAAAAALAFDGPSGRVNVVLVLAVLVGVQWLGLAVAVLALVPGGDRLPLLGTLHGSAWRRLLARMARRDAVRGVARVFRGGRLGGALHERVRRLLLVSWSQVAATAFTVGALAWTLALVAFTDLAFGWSTTLDVTAQQAHRGAVLLATPFGWAWPAAVPSLELVEATRFFRVAPAAAGADPVLLGRWWPFVVACIGCYALLPRLVLWFAVSRSLRGAIAEVFVAAPGAQRVLARLDAVSIETRATTPEDAAPGPAAALGLTEALPEAATVVSWSGALEGHADAAAAGARLGLAADGLHRAGGHLDLAQDEAVVRALRDVRGAIVVAVRGFEAPVLELRDFLESLRDAVGAERQVVLALLDCDDPAPWARFLDTLGDPRLAAAVGPPGRTAEPETPQRPALDPGTPEGPA